LQLAVIYRCSAVGETGFEVVGDSRRRDCCGRRRLSRKGGGGGRSQSDVHRLCELVDSDDWTLEQQEGEWQMFTQTDAATGSIRYKGQVAVRASRERLMGFLHSVPQAKDKW
jgi:hypothetical protein